jgi:monoamine oxidase
VTDPNVCGRAGLAYARELQQHLAPGSYQTVVIKAGNRYLVRSVTAPEPAGEWTMMLVLDAKFRLADAILF